jgi:hypothetical protein
MKSKTYAPVRIIVITIGFYLVPLWCQAGRARLVQNLSQAENGSL